MIKNPNPTLKSTPADPGSSEQPVRPTVVKPCYSFGGVALWMRALRYGYAALWASVLLSCCGSRGAESKSSAQAAVLRTTGKVEFSPARSVNWYDAGTNQMLYAGDQLRTGERSRATLRLRDLTILPLDELTTVMMLDRPQGAALQLLRGVISFFHRDRPGEIEVRGGGVNATIRGTEFVFRVDGDGAATITIFDGVVEMANAFGNLVLHSGEVGVARPGEAPRKTAVLQSNDLTAIQWALYYPAILDLNDLGWNARGEEALRASVQQYRAGNLPRALASYPSARQPASREEKLFLAALLLAVGNVEEAERWLAEFTGDDQLIRLARAHRDLIAAVKRQPCSSGDLDGEGKRALLATELLAASYCLQSQSKLKEALQAARLTTERSPQFGFGWARLAELEFSFGRTREAEAALTAALSLTPQNAQAVALQGFLLAARNEIETAQERFDNAIALDGALGNAWLGRGLCKIRRGEVSEGRADLQVAAAIEPQRAVFRSYLGKAFAEEWLDEKALHEISLAKKIDPADSTGWGIL